MAQTFYQVLGVDPDAPHRLIVQRYQQLLREARTALAAGKAMPLERLDAIRIAYRALSNAQERSLYDTKLARARVAQPRIAFAAIDRRKTAVALLTLVTAAGAAWTLLQLAQPRAEPAPQLSFVPMRAAPPSGALALAQRTVSKNVARPQADTPPTLVRVMPGDPPLYAAAAAGDYTATERLLSQGAELHAKGAFGTALHAAVANGHDQVVELLLQRGASVSVARSAGGARALHVLAYAKPAQAGHSRMLSLLLRHGADPEARDAQGNTALLGFLRERTRTLEYVQTLVAHYSNKSWWGLSQAPMLAAANAREPIEFLLDQGYHVDQPDEQGATLLHYAGYSDDATLTRLLLARGAQVDTRTNAGMTALHYARRAEQVSALIAAGADVNARDAEQRTPLHNVNVLHIDALAQLLAAHALANAVDAKGDTALHLAANYGSVDKIRLLLHSGADADLANRAGMTPAMLADRRGYRPVIELLAAAQ